MRLQVKTWLQKKSTENKISFVYISTCQGLGGQVSVVDTGQVQPLGEQGSDACDSQPRCSHGSLNSGDSTHQNESKECRGQQRGCSPQPRSGNEASSAFQSQVTMGGGISGLFRTIFRLNFTGVTVFEFLSHRVPETSLGLVFNIPVLKNCIQTSNS